MNEKKLYLLTVLIGKPKLIVLDEPMNGLDVKSIIKLKEFLLEINKERNLTILFSSHILSEMSSICNKIGIITAGAYADLKEYD